MAYIESTLSESQLNYLLGSCTLLLSVIVFTFNIIAGSFLLLITWCVFSTKNRLQLDLSKRKYRKGLFLFNRTFASWQDLPENLDYLVTIPATFTSKTVSRGNAEISNKYQEYVINIIYSNRKRFLVYQNDNPKEVISVAEKIGESLSIPVRLKGNLAI